ncbi:hypothetical protein IV102_20125 [bacterium]|nr:hypothetical protein [bacterium]
MSEPDNESAPKLPAPPPAANPYTPGKLFGVAVVGAGCSLFLYYLFQQLEPDQKRRIRGTAVRGVKDQVRGWVSRDDSTGEA